MEESITHWFAWLLSSLAKELTWCNALVYGGILLLSWLVSKLFILPQLSPLRKIPGRPRGNLLLGCFPEILQKEAVQPFIEWMNEMKTGIIRYHHIMGSQRIVLTDADAMKHVLVTKASNYPRPVFLFGFFREVVGLSLLTLEGQEHLVQRRLCNHAFKLPVLLSLLPMFQRHIDHLCRKWREKVQMGGEGSAKVDIHSSLSNAVSQQVFPHGEDLTFDIITDSGFGYNSNSLEDPENFFSKAFTYVLGGGLQGVHRVVRIFIPQLYRYIPNEDNRLFHKSLKSLHDLIQTIIGNKRKSLESKQSSDESHSRDLLEILLAAVDVETGVGLSETQLQDHSMTFLLAGRETTATGLSWILLCLAQHPEIQRKARAEVISVLPPASHPITSEHLDQLVYTTCIVKETLRLYPPAPIVMREAKEDDILCGFPIPKGTIINLAIGAMHRNPAYWDSPDEFKPERFLDESKVPPHAYQPFINGPHMCIGYKFALLELRLALAMLLRQFEFSPLPDVVYKKKQTITMRPHPPLKLNVRCLN